MRYNKILLFYLIFMPPSFAHHINSISLECTVEKYQDYGRDSEVAIMQRDTEIGDKFWITSVKKEPHEYMLRRQNTEQHVLSDHSGYADISIIYSWNACNHFYLKEDDDKFSGKCDAAIGFTSGPEPYLVTYEINRSSGLFEIDQFQNEKSAVNIKGTCEKRNKDL